MTYDVITIVRDPEHILGKRFSLETDGTVKKKAAVAVGFAYAEMRHVPDLAALQALLEEVSEDTNAAIINAGFTGIEVGEKFIILSAYEFEEQLKLIGREAQKGVHPVKVNGVKYKAVGRFKENVYPSSYQYLDRDVDKHTPPEFATADFQQWIEWMGQVFEYLPHIQYLRAHSTSARVLHNGNSVGAGNGHTWIKVKDPLDVERTRRLPDHVGAWIVQMCKVGPIL